VPLYLRWVNDFEVVRSLSVFSRPTTFESEQGWYDAAANDPYGVLFTVYQREGLRPIGTTGLHRIDHLHRTAEFGIMIGEKECWGRGYGTEVTRLVLAYGFDVLNLHNIMLWVHADNERGIRAYLRAGFREVGRRREARRRDGQTYDIVMMDCLATDFRARADAG
jgi:RimJ/RimL family protein N-acetyltransferase